MNFGAMNGIIVFKQILLFKYKTELHEIKDVPLIVQRIRGKTFTRTAGIIDPTQEQPNWQCINK